MVKVCCLKTCPSGRKKRILGPTKKVAPQSPLSFFQARTPKRLEKWKRSLGVELKKSDYLCHLHFKEEDIKMYEKFYIKGELMIFPTGNKTLRDNALPTIEHQFVPIPDLKFHTLISNVPQKSSSSHTPYRDEQECQEQDYIKREELILDPDDSDDNLTDDKEHTNQNFEEILLSPQICEDFKNHQEIEGITQSVENFTDNILKLSTLPPSWLYVEKPNGLEFMRINPTTKRIKNHIRVNKDLTVTVIFPNNEESLLNVKFKSFHNAYNFLKSIERWPLCVGTGIENNKYSKTCKGVVIGEDTYKITQQYPRCKSCRFLRKRLKNLETTSTNIERKKRTVQVCRICLTTGIDECKLISMKLLKLEKFYYNLTGVMISKNDKLPKTVCRECAYRLITFNKFRIKSLRSNSIMMNLLDEQQNLSLKSIINVDRERNQLKTGLNYKHYGPDHCDLHVIENDSHVEEIKFVPDLNVVSELKNEIQNIIDESIEPVKEEYEENDLAINNEIVIDNDTDLDNGIITDKGNVKDDYSTMPNDDYSTDDSQPIGLLIKARDGKRKAIPATKRRNRQKSPLIVENNFTISESLSFEEQVADLKKRSESANFKKAPFKCTDCFKGFSDDIAYTSHMERHTDECGLHACPVCKLRFKRFGSVRYHVAVQHAQRHRCRECAEFVTTHRQTARLHELWHKGGRYECPYCPEVFQEEKAYMSHRRTKHASYCDFVCTLCGLSCVSAQGLRAHKNFKHRSDDQQIPEDGPLCEPCGLRFSSRDALQQHLLVSTKHGAVSNRRRYVTRPPQSPVICELCGVQLGDRRQYVDHVRNKHADKGSGGGKNDKKTPCMCEQCGRILKGKAMLKYHMWVHSKEKRFKCDRCDKTFIHRSYLRWHSLKHSANKPLYQCPICEKSFYSNNNRRRHMNLHTGQKPHKCDLCPKRFMTAYDKRAHIDYTHNKKPKRYKCDVCDRGFIYRSNLEVHALKHNAARPLFECEECGKTFKSDTNRRRHMIMHTGQKPYGCGTCGKRFTTASGQRRHDAHVHHDVPRIRRAQNTDGKRAQNAEDSRSAGD